MNQPFNLPPARLDLAAGFAACIASWARDQGAAEQSVAVLAAAAARVSLDGAEGHVCAHLDDVVADLGAGDADGLRADLLASGMVGLAGSSEILPLVLDGAGRLYLYRYYDYEQRLAAALMRRAAHPLPPTGDIATLRARLDAAFGADQGRRVAQPDWQKLAVALALERRLTIISGGPGTGKTSTVAALLACILEQQPQARIALAAPTGKAAARMMEALAGRARHLAPEIRERLPREAHTIHRLLGVATGSSRFRHHAGNPLALDVLVVDEASMLDLALAVHLVEAIPEDARLILLGDKDQLAAVEAGAVFGELTADPTLSAGCVQRLAAATGTPAEAIQADAPPVTPPLADGVMWLTESHRFGSDSDVGRLAALVNAGAAEAALDQLTASKGGSLAWLEDAGAELCPAVRTRIVDGYAAYVDALRRDSADASAVFAAFDRFRVLCALRDAPRGVDAANALIGEHVRCALDHALDPGPESHWYPGRPVMVLRNDYTLKLFNGDIGICLPDEKGELLVTFPSVDGAWRRIAPVRLPPHDTAFAITVHKAQGSEFAAVLLVLPRHAAKVVVRELLYTAITRASESVVICGAVEVFRSACMQPTLRRSGLTARMQEAIATSEAPRPSHLLDPEQGALRIP